MRKLSTAGFTLIELMVTIAIVAILLTVALPSFQGSMRSNRLATSTNELISSVSLARSEALRNRRGAGLCATANGTTCGTDWNQGWMIWADNGTGALSGNGVLDSGEAIVRHIPAHPALNLTVGAGTIAFNNRGGAVAGASFVLRPISCPATLQLVNTLTLNGSGQVKTGKSACP